MLKGMVKRLRLFHALEKIVKGRGSLNIDSTITAMIDLFGGFQKFDENFYVWRHWYRQCLTICSSNCIVLEVMAPETIKKDSRDGTSIRVVNFRIIAGLCNKKLAPHICRMDAAHQTC